MVILNKQVSGYQSHDWVDTVAPHTLVARVLKLAVWLPDMVAMVEMVPHVRKVAMLLEPKEWEGHLDIPQWVSLNQPDMQY